jgi:F-type H+-transporting ATPase subunit b
LELSWTTFLLEIVNFLVLVWILKRFLYKPVLEVIARRRAGIEKSLADAAAQHADAEKLKQQYEGRLANWDKEREQARAKLAQELEAERSRRMAELQGALEQEQAKRRTAEERRQADAMRKIEETALAQGVHFAARLLDQAAGPETQARLVDLVVDSLGKLPAERITALRNSFTTAPATVIVTSAYPLANEQQQNIAKSLAKLVGSDTSPRFEQDHDLVAGVRISVGAWVLGANVKDELKGFAELAHDD